MSETTEAAVVSDVVAPREVRKPLTQTQLRAIGETQVKLAQLKAALADAEREAKQVISLVFDAQGVPPEAQATLDEKTGELVYTA